MFILKFINVWRVNSMSGYIYKNVKKTLWINIKRIHVLFLHIPIQISQVCLTPPPPGPPPPFLPPPSCKLKFEKGGLQLSRGLERTHTPLIYLSNHLPIHLSIVSI